MPQSFKLSCLVALGVPLLLSSNCVHAQTFDEKFEVWPVDLKINGRILVDNGSQDLEPMEELLRRIVEGKKTVCFGSRDEKVDDLTTALMSLTGDRGSFKVIVSQSFPEDELQAALKEANVIVLHLGRLLSGNHDALMQLKPDFERFIDNRGTLIVDPAMARYLGEYVQVDVSAGQTPSLASGLNLLPNCVLRCNTSGQQQTRRELLSTLALHPKCVGIALDDHTLLMLAGRKMTCYGTGEATFLLMANQRTPLRIESIVARRDSRQPPQKYLVDLTEWRRDAIDRTLPQFPPAVPDVPFVAKGTLVIVGGGGMPRGLMDRFIELAGGKEKARLVYIPCSERENVGESHPTVESWKRSGVQHATFLHTKDRNKANSDDAFLAPLKEATGIWFGGGRQWNMADSYYGTKAHKLMKDVLRRGGVIGGSSAGASIQGRYLARATPIGNFRIMAPGYERGGLGFLSGVAIDQHFSQRGRQKDMTQLVNRHPQLLGIGLDEATAIIVQKSIAKVVGRGRVHFYDRNQLVYPDRPDYTALTDGSTYDLAARKVLVASPGSTVNSQEGESQSK